MAQEATLERIQELARELQEADTPSQKFKLSAELARASRQIAPHVEEPIETEHKGRGSVGGA